MSRERFQHGHPHHDAHLDLLAPSSALFQPL
jgi:hypothetical protein